MKSGGNAKLTPSDEKSSAGTGPTSPATKTLFISENQRAEVRLSEYARLSTTGGGKAGRGYPAVLISSAEDSPAKTSPSPGAEQDSTASEVDSSSSSSESLTLFSQSEDGSSLRMYPDFFHPTVDEISPSFSRRWPKSGFMTSPGECWTVDTSEYPSGGGVSSSLEDVVLDEVPPRFYLSQKAAVGILRRASRRKRKLPGALQTALEALARMETQAQPTRSTGPTPSQRTAPAEEFRSSVRRLTPTECERLQGFPDGWTILRPTDDDTPPAETPSP